MFINWTAALLFVIGIICVALAVTYLPIQALMLAGIIIAGVGVALSNIFRES